MTLTPTATPPATPPPAGQAGEYLTPKLRKDLVVQKVFYEGVTHYVVKEPIALKYFRFKIEEFFLLEQLDGKRTLLDVKRAFERNYRPQTISIDDLVRFVAQLHEAGIVQIDTPEQAQALIDRARKKKWKKIAQFATNILYIKIPVTDPERLLTWMYPYLRWIFTPYFMAFSVGLMLAALGLVASQWDTFYAKLPTFDSFFNWKNILFFWCSLGIVKVIHEFGHGLTAKHYGGEVHEMGILFLVLTPCLYCDVTDSWLLPNKWHRIWIAAAGIYVEVVIASLATFVWWNTDEGLINSLSLATMFICSVNTVMFNANPLLRYDGYYVASDWLEIPNLRIKSQQFFTNTFQEKVLGLEVPPSGYMPRSRRQLFIIYAVASYFYRWFITISIIWFLYNLLKPYGLGSISAMLAMGAGVPLLGMPLYKMGKFVVTPGRMRKVKKLRATAILGGFAAVVATVLLIPFPYYVQGTFFLEPRDISSVYVKVPGRLTEIGVRDGDWIGEPGVRLASLSNPELLRERRMQEAELDLHYIWAEHYSSINSGHHRAVADSHVQAAEELRPAVDTANEQVAKLVLTAPQTGQIIGAPHPREMGRFYRSGEVYCQIGDPKRLVAHLIMEQTDIDLIREGNKTWLKVYGNGEQTFTSEVDDIAGVSREEIPPELSYMAGGEIAAEPDQQTGAVRPLNAMYEVLIPVDNEELRLHVGQRGYAKIYGGEHCLGWRFGRFLAKIFHFAM